MPHAKLSLELRMRLKPFCLGLPTFSLVLPRASFHNLQRQCQFMDHFVSSGLGLWLLNILSCSPKVVQPSYCTGCTWYGYIHFSFPKIFGWEKNLLIHKNQTLVQWTILCTEMPSWPPYQWQKQRIQGNEHERCNNCPAHQLPRNKSTHPTAHS